MPENAHPLPRLHLIAFGGVGGLVLERFLAWRHERFLAHALVEDEGDLPPWRALARWRWSPPSGSLKQLAHELGSSNALCWSRGDLVAAIAPAAVPGTLAAVERLLAHAYRADCDALFLLLGEVDGEDDERRAPPDVEDLALKLAAELAVALPGLVGTDWTEYLRLRRELPARAWGVGAARAGCQPELPEAARRAARCARRGLAGRPLRAFITVGVTLAAGLGAAEQAARATCEALDFGGDVELNVEALRGERWDVEIGVAIAGAARCVDDIGVLAYLLERG